MQKLQQSKTPFNLCRAPKVSEQKVLYLPIDALTRVPTALSSPAGNSAQSELRQCWILGTLQRYTDSSQQWPLPMARGCHRRERTVKRSVCQTLTVQSPTSLYTSQVGEMGIAMRLLNEEDREPVVHSVPPNPAPLVCLGQGQH